MPEFIIFQQAVDTHQSFAFMLYCFHPKSKAGNTTDHPFKFFSQIILHVLYLLVFIGSSFRFHRRPFPFTAMLAFFFQFFIRMNRLFSIHLQNTMHHHIRIAADRRSKMTIMLKAQSIMADIFCSVFCFCHCADTQLFQHMLFRFAMYIFQQLIK